jgi:hypothetical protein
MMLRLFLLVTLATAACGDDDGGGGGGSTDAAPTSDAAISIDGGDHADAAVPDAGAAKSCAPSGECELGPACGDVCCGAGEACVDGACRCGEHDPCEAEQTCAVGGPQGEDDCGQFCCGPGGPPCPD